MKNNIYTYVVDHGDESPAIGAGIEINGGILTAVQFNDALERISEFENFLEQLRNETDCDQTRYSIDDFMN
jgi:hypothetical protein